MLTKQEILLGKGTWVESSRVKEPRRTALPCIQFYGDGISFMVTGCLNPIILIQSLSWCQPCSAKMDASKDSGRWLDIWCLLLTFPELFRLVEAY